MNQAMVCGEDLILPGNGVTLEGVFQENVTPITLEHPLSSCRVLPISTLYKISSYAFTLVHFLSIEACMVLHPPISSSNGATPLLFNCKAIGRYIDPEEEGLVGSL